MKDFKHGTLDTDGVLELVALDLFIREPALIAGFNRFLPHGYYIKIEWHSDFESIQIKTPTVDTMMGLPRAKRKRLEEVDNEFSDPIDDAMHSVDQLQQPHKKRRGG